MKTVTVTIRMTPEQAATIDEAATRAGLSRSAYIVQAATSAEHKPNTSQRESAYKPHTGEHKEDISPDIADELAEIRRRLDALEKNQQRRTAPARSARNTPPGGSAELPKDESESARVYVDGIPPDPTIPPGAGGRYDEAAVLAMIEKLRLEQTANGFKPDNKQIAAALNNAGLLQSNGRPWNNDRVNTVITRKLPHLKG